MVKMSKDDRGKFFFLSLVNQSQFSDLYLVDTNARLANHAIVKWQGWRYIKKEEAKNDEEKIYTTKKYEWNEMRWKSELGWRRYKYK